MTDTAFIYIVIMIPCAMLGALIGYAVARWVKKIIESTRNDEK